MNGNGELSGRPEGTPEKGAAEAAAPGAPEPLGAPEAPSIASADPVDDVLQVAGSRYLTELQMVRDEVRRIYDGQLKTKDREIAELHQRLALSERDRATLTASLHRLQDAFSRQVADLRTLGDEVRQRADKAERDKDTTLALLTD